MRPDIALSVQFYGLGAKTRSAKAGHVAVPRNFMIGVDALLTAWPMTRLMTRQNSPSPSAEEPLGGKAALTRSIRITSPASSHKPPGADGREKISRVV